MEEFFQMETLIAELHKDPTCDLSSEEAAVIAIVQLRAELVDWSDTRARTIGKLREIADYIDTVAR